MDLKNNVFYNNSAIIGGAGIYFKNKILKESPSKFNTFSHNTAFFANDFYTFPIKLHFQDDKNYKSWVNKSSFSITFIPGITKINLNFSVVDYSGQTLKSVNRFFSSLKISIYSFEVIRLCNSKTLNFKK